LIAVAVTVILLPVAAGTVWLKLTEQVERRALIRDYQAKAVHHAELESKFARLSEYSDKGHMLATRGGQRVHIPIVQRDELIPKYQELAKYHGALRQKYEYARWHPWLPLEPDPPPPEPPFEE
jgi:hypothetical protein